jgi:zinc protease
MKTAWKFFFNLIIFCCLPTCLLFSQQIIFEQFQLQNGLRIYFQKDSTPKITTVFFFFSGGQKLEPGNKAGLSSLTTRLMAEVPDEGKLAELVSLGINLSAGSRPDFSFVQVDCLSAHLEKALKIISSSLKDPLFSGPRIDYIKRILLAEGRKESCRLVDSGLICLRRRFFPSLSYGQSLFGTEAGLKAISKKDITELYEKISNSDSLSLIIVSDLESETIKQVLSKYFSDLKPLPKKLEPASSSPDISRVPASVNCPEYQGAPGAAVIIAYVLPGTVSETFPRAYLMEKIIGEGPGSYLWNLRQENTLAYNLNSQLEIIGDKVILLAYLETEAKATSVALGSLKKIFVNLFESGLSEKEIETGRLLARSSYFRESFSRDVRANRLALFLANNLSFEYSNNFLEALERVTASSLNELIHSTFRPEAAIEIIVSRD